MNRYNRTRPLYRSVGSCCVFPGTANHPAWGLRKEEKMNTVSIDNGNVRNTVRVCANNEPFPMWSS